MARKPFIRAALVVASAAVLAGGATATAAKPTIERVPIDGSFLDNFLTTACGVNITTTERGHLIVRTFEDEDSPHVEVFTVNISLTAVGPGGSIRFRDVGADRTVIDENGDVIISLHGRLPFDFTGTLVLNDTTGEVLHEPQHTTVDDVEAACERLT